MPEGDSLYRLAHRLRPLLAGRTLTHADLRVPAHATADLTGWTVASVEPRAKYLLMRLTPPAPRAAEGAEPLTLLSHLKMEGRWIATALADRWPAPGWQVRAVLETEDHRFVGAQLGLTELIRTADEQQRLCFLGPDLLDPAWEAPDAHARVLLTASEAVRTARRSGQLAAAGEPGVDAGTLHRQVAGRDARDATVSTFDRPAEGVALVDSTELDFEQTVAAVLAAVEDQAGTPAVKGGRR